MSGGSFNYLYGKNLGEIALMEELGEMAIELESYGKLAEIPARMTRQLMEEIENTEKEMIDPLRDIWHAVEWHCSGDSSAEEVVAAVHKFHEARKS